MIARAHYIEQRVDDLETLGRKRDADSVNRILTELSNPEKEIRKAAVEALVQSGDRSVIPRLQELAANTEDLAEKTELNETIDFLKLPSLTEKRPDWKASAQTNAPRTSQRTNGPARKHRQPKQTAQPAP